MEPARDPAPTEAIVRFFDNDLELTEEEFLAKHPESWAKACLAKLRSEYRSTACSCHGKSNEFHVTGANDGCLELEIDWCEEEYERNAKEGRARRAAEEKAAISVGAEIGDPRCVGTWILSTGVTWTLNSDGTGVAERSAMEQVWFRWSLRDNDLTLSGSRSTQAYEITSIAPNRIEAKSDDQTFVWLRQ